MIILAIIEFPWKSQRHLSRDGEADLFILPTLLDLSFANVRWGCPYFNVDVVFTQRFVDEAPCRIYSNCFREGRWNGKFEVDGEDHGWKPAAANVRVVKS
jgi:hypothetical protein